MWYHIDCAISFCEWVCRFSGLVFHPCVLVCTQVKADRNSTRLTTLQQASRHVNQMAANVVASTRTGQEHLEEKGESNLTWPQDLCRLWQAPNNPVLSCADTMDFSGMSLIKLRKEEMESQVRFLCSLLAETRETWGDATVSLHHGDFFGVSLVCMDLKSCTLDLLILISEKFMCF